MPTLEGATHTNIVTFTYRPARSDATKSHYDSRPAGVHAETHPRPKRARRVWVAGGTLMGCLSLLWRLIMFDSITVSQIKEYADRGHRVGEIAAAFQIGRKAVAKIVKGQTHPNVRPAGHVKALDKMAEVVAAQKRAAERRRRAPTEEAGSRGEGGPGCRSGRRPRLHSRGQEARGPGGSYQRTGAGGPTPALEPACDARPLGLAPRLMASGGSALAPSRPSWP